MKHLELLERSPLKLEIAYFREWGWHVELYGHGGSEGVCVGVGRARSLDEACRVAIVDHRGLRAHGEPDV